MDKNAFGKGAGIGGIIAVIVTVLCQVLHNGGVP